MREPKRLSDGDRRIIEDIMAQNKTGSFSERSAYAALRLLLSHASAIEAEFAAAKAECERLRKLAKQFAETNTKLRRIACHVPVRVWMKASEECGYGNTVSINDHKIDEAWLEFTSVKPKEPTAAGQECDE